MAAELKHFGGRISSLKIILKANSREIGECGSILDLLLTLRGANILIVRKRQLHGATFSRWKAVCGCGSLSSQTSAIRSSSRDVGVESSSSEGNRDTLILFKQFYLTGKF